MKRLVAAPAALLASLLFLASAEAADTVRAAKAVPVAWSFIPLDVGQEAGIWKKYDIDIEISALAGDAKLQQALAANSLDFGLGSGPSMAFSAKGAPSIAVAAFAGAPRNLAVVVGEDSPIKTVKDLKGKLLAVTTAGSLTEWLAKRLSIDEGWGTDGVKTAALGSFEAFLAALRTHQIDGMMLAVEAGYGLEEKHAGRIIVAMDRFAPHFHTHVVFTRRTLIKENPALVKRFLQGFFASIAYMKAHREETIQISMKVLNQSRAAMEKTYDYEISMLLDDGSFDPQAIKVLKDSYVEMGILTERPRDDQIFDAEFVPVKP
jgi:NitT/TauT family transport system substrate-binding protein